jgi:hypothetical protein
VTSRQRLRKRFCDGVESGHSYCDRTDVQWSTHWGLVPTNQLNVNSWIYFATSRKASLPATLESVVNLQLLWRSARNIHGALIANVRDLREDDHIVIAWRHSSGRRTAYLRSRIAAPLAPADPYLVIDTITGEDAHRLAAAGYPANAAGMVEAIRLDDIEECTFDIEGTYGGNNSLYRLAAEDVANLGSASAISPSELMEAPRGPRPLRQASREPSQSGMCVDGFTFASQRADRAFDSYVMVDWSAASHPVTGPDSIWIASGGWHGNVFRADAPMNVATRARAVTELERLIKQSKAENRRILLGLDFAFGYPSGFAAALGLSTAGASWKALHSYIASQVTDTSENLHNRDTFADACNRIIGAPGPFWGCAKTRATQSLTQHRVGVFSYPHMGLQEWRMTDREARKRTVTQSVWKLNCGVSVGGQTILGIKHLHRLAETVQGHVWPFDGWGTPSGPAIWFAEIFPTLVQYPDWSIAYATERDRTQVQSCLRFAAERDADGLLRADFARPGHLADAGTLAMIEDEEGWILWVT